MPIALLLYFTLPVPMLARGWLIRASATMIGTSLLPWVFWRLTIEGDYGPGAGFALLFTAIMLLPPVVLLVVGVIRLIVRLAKGRKRAS